MQDIINRMNSVIVRMKNVRAIDVTKTTHYCPYCCKNVEEEGPCAECIDELCDAADEEYQMIVDRNRGLDYGLMII